MERRNSTELKLENICNGYPIDEFSIGRKLMCVFFQDLFGVNFDKNDISNLNELVEEHTFKDANAAYQTLRFILNDIKETNLPCSLEKLLQNDEVKRFENEGDYLRYLAEKPTDYELEKKLNKFTRDEILKVRKGESELLEIADTRKIDLYSFDPKSFRGVGRIATIRRKTFKSVLKKDLSRISDIFITDQDILEDAILNYFVDKSKYKIFKSLYGFDPYEDPQKAYTILAFDKIKLVLSCNKDIQSCFDKSRDWDGLESVRTILKNLALVDVGGFSYTGTRKQVIKFDNVARSVKFDKIISGRIKDNLTLMTKDSSLVIPFRGGKPGEYVEGRVAPFDNLLYGAFGFKGLNQIIMPHSPYKKEEDQKIFRNINFSDLFGLYSEVFVNSFGYSNIKELYKNSQK